VMASLFVVELRFYAQILDKIFGGGEIHVGISFTRFIFILRYIFIF
jgi:hypothetical protein